MSSAFSLAHNSVARKRRTGAAVVEFAIIAPLFFALVIGIVEFGRALMVQQILTNASREGSRRAIVEGVTQTEVKGVVENYLTEVGVSNASVSISPASLQTVGFGDPVTVKISVPYSSVSWMGSPFFLSDIKLQASSTMRGERLQ